MDDSADITINFDANEAHELADYIIELQNALQYYKYVVSITRPDMIINLN